MSKAPLTIGAAQEWINHEYGGLFEQRISAVSCPFGTITQLVPTNADRVSLLFSDVGASDVQLIPQSSVSSFSSGPIISAVGGSLSMNIRQDQNLPTLQWSGNSQAVAGTTVFILEVVRLVRTGDVA